MSTEHRLKTIEVYNPQPSELGEGYAYNVNAYPEQADDLIVAQIGKLDAYYDLMLSGTNELALRHAVNRSLVMATGAPIYHLMELEADRRFLNSITHRELDVASYTEAMPDHTSRLNLEGEYGNFSDIFGAANATAASSVLQSLQDPEHPYRRVWELFNIFLPEFAETERQVRGHERPTDPTKAITQAFTDLGEDTIMKVLMQSVFHFHDDLGLKGSNITRKLFSHLEELSWAARTKRNYLAANFPDALTQEGTSASCPFKPINNSVFTDNTWGNMAPLWERDGMTNGFKEIPGFCPAVVDMTPLKAEGQSVVESMHGLAAPYVRNRYMTRLYGTSTAAELTLIRSIFILDKTIIKLFT